MFNQDEAARREEERLMRHCRGGSRPAPRPVCPSLSCFDSSFYPSQLLFFNRTEGRPPRDAWDCVVPAQHGPAPCTAVVRTEAGTCRSPAAGIACTGSSHRPASREPRRGRFVVVFLSLSSVTLVFHVWAWLYVYREEEQHQLP